MKVLVTGGAGYIGSHTVSELAHRGYEVVILDTLEPKEGLRNIPFYTGDLNNENFLEEIFAQEKPDAVMHFAAYKAPGESMQEPSKYFRNNIGGLIVLLDTMVRHDLRSLVFSSSCSIFGTPEHLPVAEDFPIQPESVYGETKAMGETILKWYDITKKIRSSSLRYFNACGASLDNQLGENWDNTHNLIPLVMKAATGYSDAITVFGTDYPTPDGTAIRDYVHVVDLAIAHIKALEQIRQEDRSTTYNLGTGTGHSVQEIITAARRVTDIDFKVIYGPRRPGDPVATWADCTKAEQELGWKAQYGLDTILETAWHWHSTHPTAPIKQKQH